MSNDFAALEERDQKIRDEIAGAVNAGSGMNERELRDVLNLLNPSDLYGHRQFAENIANMSNEALDYLDRLEAPQAAAVAHVVRDEGPVLSAEDTVAETRKICEYLNLNQNTPFRVLQDWWKKMDSDGQEWAPVSKEFMALLDNA